MMGKWLIRSEKYRKLIEKLFEQIQGEAKRSKGPLFYFDLTTVMLRYLKEKVSGELDESLNEGPAAPFFQSRIIFSLEPITNQNDKNRLIFGLCLRILEDGIFPLLNTEYMKRVLHEELAAEASKRPADPNPLWLW